jgi:hypothetical protein
MTRHPRFLWIITVALGLVLACGPLSNGMSPSPTGGTSSSSKSTSGPASDATGESPTQYIPLVPNPLNVQITLDTARAQTNINPAPFYGQTTNGTIFQFNLPDYMVSVDADGTLQPAYDTPVTLTPVATIEGLPFSQGFLAAVNLSPEGLLLVGPGTLTLTIPSEYDPATLVGFAADGNGNNFHLYPVDISVSPVYSGFGGTAVTFDVLHFSIYGFAQATVQEVLSQQEQVPEGETAQNEDLLVDLPPASEDDDLLVPINEPALTREHQQFLNYLPRALSGDCNAVDVAAQMFINWHTHVKNMGGTAYFQSTINTDTQILLSLLITCMEDVCQLCLDTPPGPARSVDSFLIHTFYAEQIASITGNEDEARWRRLADRCAVNAGRPLPHPAMSECGPGSDCTGGGPTVAPPQCP